MKCPFCGFMESKVLDSRPADDGNAIRRRRECADCGRRFTTYEKIDEIPLVVVKKDGRREVFDRAKILGGIIKAGEKRSISMQQMEQMVNDIEKEIRNRMDIEVGSEQIGEFVMDRLRKLDEVAYVRFASVYRQFQDINSFIDELEKLLKRKAK
ncbi:transcriptional regulator NrdR [Phosphitispora fastidiosa]|uniref:transcriptional regulator NrdR n=1 Tax=Phosphitispora fastidiosa TaxID=2837202 RepID=UPI001E303068|nr:transcriptional regulator NrdR [Phosphitispora fastidiosa]MBU7005599.1 transcriptional repressor NrdR [Phosphitispora fastidiosa]